MSLQVILLGAPGAGKGTQATQLSKEYQVPHISTGDMFRESLKKGTPLGLEAKKYMEKGELVPDKVVVAMVRERLIKDDASNGFLLDGFPRTDEQAKQLDQMLGEINKQINTVVYIKTSEAIVIARLTGRRVCESCGRIYNIPNLLPKKEGICDDCQGKIIQRKDDTKETVLNRLKVYESQTASLIEYYKKQQKLFEVSGDGVAEETKALIKTNFDQLLGS